MSHFRPIKMRSYGALSYGCGCGCGGSGGCGSSYGDCGCGCGGSGGCGGGQGKWIAHAYGPAIFTAPAHIHQAVRTVPAYGWSPSWTGAVFEKYNASDTWYRKCVEYKKAVDDFESFRAKAVEVYGEKLKRDGQYLSCGGHPNCKKDPHLASTLTADNRLLALQGTARAVLEKCKIAEEGLEEGDTGTVTTQTLQGGGLQQQVANVPPPAEGAGLPMGAIAVGGVALVGLLGVAVIIKNKRRAAKLAKAAAAGGV